MSYFAVFDIHQPDSAAEVPGIVAALAADVDTRMRHAPGLLLSRLHASLDGAVAVHHTRWATEPDYRHGRGAGHPGGEAAVTLTGTVAGVIRGPSAGRPPGVVAIAIRHFSGPDPAAVVLGLLHRSAGWKQRHPGFIGAEVTLSADSRTFVNYPAWADRGAYDAWMADPRIATGQAEIARLESAPPRYLVCTVEHDVAGEGG
jgi:heme-degrading monooxygenase HmoA